MPAAKTALLVIDVQRGIFLAPRTAREKEVSQALNQMVMRIAGLIERARGDSVPVIYVQHDGVRGHRLEPATSGWPIRSEIAPRAGEQVIRKRASDSFFETALDAELAAAHIKRLVVCGCMTQYCIDTTARRAVSMGYDVVLVGDGHMTEDSLALRYEQIIAHHNAVLDGFDAGGHEVRVCTCAEIELI